MDYGDTSCSHRNWKTTRGLFIAIVVITSASCGVVLHTGTTYSHSGETATDIGAETVLAAAQVSGNVLAEEKMMKMFAARQEKTVIEGQEQEAADVVLTAVAIPKTNNPGQGTIFNIIAHVPAGTLASPVLVYIDVSELLAKGEKDLTEIAAQSTVSGSRVLGAVGGSSDGVHLLWTIANIIGQEAVLTLKAGPDDAKGPWGIVVKTLKDDNAEVRSNCEVDRLEANGIPSDPQCSVKKGIGHDNTAATNDITALIAVSEVSEGSATVAVDFYNDDSSAHVGAGGFIMVDIRELIGPNVTLDEKTLPPGSSVGKDSLMLPLPEFKSTKSGQESGTVTFNVIVSEEAANVVLNPILVSVKLPESETAVSCSKFKEESVCSIVETACRPDARATALTVEAEADGIKEVHTLQGATVEYTIKVKNKGNKTVTTPVIVDITDVLRHAAMEIPPSGKGIGLSPDQKVLKWNLPGGFQPNRTYKIKYTVRVNADTPAGESLTSKVIGTQDSPCFNKKPIDAACEAKATVLADTEARAPEPAAERTGLAVKTFVNGYSRAIYVKPGQQLRYSVELTNTSKEEITNVKLTQEIAGIAPYVHLLSDILHGFMKSSTEEKLTWGEAAVPAGETITLGYRVNVKESVKDGGPSSKQLTVRTTTDLLEKNNAEGNPARDGNAGFSSNCSATETPDLDCIATVTLAGAPGSADDGNDKADASVTHVIGDARGERRRFNR